MKVVADDGGRFEAGLKGRVSDCVTRSVAIVTGRPYAEIHAAMAAINAGTRKTKRRRKGYAGEHTADNGIYTRTPAFKRYMASLGLVWTPTMTIGSGCTVHLRAGELPPGRLVVSVSKHYTAVVDGVVHDTHNPTRGGNRCVYGYWRMT